MKPFTGLPKIQPDVAALCNVLAGRQWFFEGQFRVFGSETKVVPCPVAIEFHPLETLPDRLTGLSAETAFGSFDVFVEPDFVRQISDICLPGWDQEPAAAVRPDWLALFALSQIAEMIGIGPEIETAWSQRDFMRLRPNDLTGTVSGTLHVNGAAHVFVIRTWSVQAETVAALIGNSAGWQAGMTDPGFLLDVRPATRPVALNDFKRLCPGDILLLPQTADGLPVQAWLGREMYWSGVLDFDGRAVIQGKAKRVYGMHDQDYFPSEVSEFEDGPDGFAGGDDDAWLEAEAAVAEADFEELQAPTSDFPLGQLPVRLDFKLDAKTLTLDAFSRLGGGSVLELDFDLDVALTIEANGTPVGTGQLVQIGDSVGLQIMKWHPRSTAGDE
ncbi:FliM/FliN family flagellar motor switch protein [Leisingera sp. S232]|uniref:FliM/FliN family flagellar motor switch protein n=1 Tax=Leisingera sp. S232 TaxID=3415132 RepID=UPI003C7A58CA